MSPAKIQSLLQNGLVHHRAGRLSEADALYRQARIIAPRSFEVLHASGVLALQQSRSAEAVDFLSRAIKLNPNAVVSELRLASALMALKRAPEAEEHLRHAVQIKPDLHEGWDQLALCLRAQDRFPEALRCHQKAVELKPDYAGGWVNFGFTLRLNGQIEQAIACHERAHTIVPNFAPARFGRAQALQMLHRTEAAVAEYDAFLELQPHSHEARSNRLFALHNLEQLSREQLFAQHVAYGRHLNVTASTRFSNNPDPGRRLRIAVLSPDLRTHSCAYFLLPLLRHLDNSQFEVFLYHDHFREDAMSAALRSMAAVWRNFTGMSAVNVEQQIRTDAVDVLIDLAGHTGITNRLPVLAKRVAPVQVTYLGYPNTTGVPAMDYRFIDEITDPPGADAFATEELVRFAPTAWAYSPPREAPEVGPVPSLEKGYVTFGSFNDLAKLTDRMLTVWARILSRVPSSRLRLKGRGLGIASVRSEFSARLARAGITDCRVEFMERTLDTKSHLEMYREIDVALDTFPYNGTTTTCEALWMGVPVVSMVGDRHVARVGASLLAAIGHSEWATSTDEDYAQIAVTLATQSAHLASVRRNLRTEMRAGPLLDHAAQSARFAGALRACWTRWCERTPISAMAGAA